MASHQVELVAFPIVKTVAIRLPPTRGAGFEQLPSLPLSALSVETLTQLCDDFKDAMLTEQKRQLNAIESINTGMAKR